MASVAPAFSKNSLSAWSNWLPNIIAAFAVLILLGLGVFVTRAIERLPVAPIQIQQQGLNAHEYQALQTLLGTKADGNWLQVDLQPYVDRLSQVGWIAQVDIRRDWQNGLMVKVVPRQAVAKFGSERLVDANGAVFVPADAKQLQAPYWMQLQGDSQNAVVMMQQVKQVTDWFLPLGLKVEEVIVTPRMAWLFRFDNGLRVLVDNENTTEKLYRLSVLLQNQLHKPMNKIQTVDLRYKNGMAITWRAPSITQNTPTTASVPALAKTR